MDEISSMLSPDRFSVGPISAAADGLTLVLPRSRFESMLLVSRLPDGPFAVLLSGSDPFVSFPAANNGSYSGILVPDVRIEVDPLAACDIQYAKPRPGTLARSESDLLLATMPASGGRFRVVYVPLVTGLPTLPANQGAGFLHWRVVIGEGRDKQVLARFTIEPAAEN